jgi:hypothetical protein
MSFSYLQLTPDEWTVLEEARAQIESYAQESVQLHLLLLITW